MLRQQITRKILRARAAKLQLRHYRTPEPPKTISPFHLEPPLKPQPFAPLYTPEPLSEELDFAEEERQYQRKLSLTKAAEDDNPELDEAAIRDFFIALIESGVEDVKDPSVGLLEAPKSNTSAEEREQLLEKLEERLKHSLIGSSAEQSGNENVDIQGIENRSDRIVKVLSQISLPSSSASRIGFSVKGKEKADIRPGDLPIGLVKKSEWEALFESYMERKDARGAEAVMGIMIQHGTKPDEEFINRIMMLDAYAGRIDDVTRLTTAFTQLGGELSEPQHNAFVASLLRTSPTNIQSAVQYLKQFELQGQPLPQSSYALVLKHLTTPSRYHQTTSHTRALAWELFTHMRMQAHNIPDASVYNLMITTCADSRDPQPERARDLWVEMTEEGNQVKPTRTEYDAIIRALSSTKATYLEAFDSLRQMLAKHYDVVQKPFEDSPQSLWSPFVPTPSTFIALLEGAKRAGDIERARWILSEVIGLVGSSIEIGQPMPPPDGELLSGVFMSYAAWIPKLTRSSLRMKEEDGEAEARTVLEENVTASQLQAPNLERITDPGTSVTAAGPEESVRSSPSRAPQTSAEAIREARAIFQRILFDVKARKDGGGTDFFANPFANVRLTTRLVNSYLSVELEHSASTAAMFTVWKETWEQAQAIEPSAAPNGWSYLFLLERCATGRRRTESPENKNMAYAWGKRVWRQYLEWSKTAIPTIDTTSTGTAIMSRSVNDIVLSHRHKYLLGLGPRQVEKCWKAVIKLYAQTDHTDVSLALLREFTRRYPPEEVKKGYTPFNAQGMATRITDFTKLADPDVPPHLLFGDVEVLHQRLVRKEDFVSVGAVKAITTQYAHALLKRKSYKMKNVGAAREKARYRKEMALLEKSAKKFDSLPQPADEEDMEGEWEDLRSERKDPRQSWASRKEEAELLH